MRSTPNQLLPVDAGLLAGQTRPRPRAPAARPLPDQPGGAGAVGERAAGGGCGAQPDRRRGERARARGRERCAGGQSRHAGAGTPDRRSWSPRPMARRARPALAARPGEGRAQRPAARVRRAAASASGRPWCAATAPRSRPWRLPTMPQPSRERRARSWRAPGPWDLVTDGTREVRLGNGSELMDRVTAVGLRRLGAGRRLPRGRAGRLGRGRRGAPGHGRRRRAGGRARARAGQLRPGAAGCALPAGRGHPDRSRGDPMRPARRSARLRGAGPDPLPGPLAGGDGSRRGARRGDAAPAARQGRPAPAARSTPPARCWRRWRRSACRCWSTTGSTWPWPPAPQGVHVGQDDMAPGGRPPAARSRGRSSGATVHHAAEADRLDAAIVDYAGIGPVFATAQQGQTPNRRSASTGSAALIVRARQGRPGFPCLRHRRASTTPTRPP